MFQDEITAKMHTQSSKLKERCGLWLPGYNENSMATLSHKYGNLLEFFFD